MTHLPEGWRRATLGDEARIVSGATPKTAVGEFWGGGIAWLTPDDLSKNRSKVITHGARFLTKAGYESCSARVVPEGSVLFTSRAPIGYVAIAGGEVCTNQGFKSAIPGENLDSEFLYYQLQYATPEIRSRASGTTFLEISGKGFSATPIVLPPVSEQRRIVEILEEQFSRLDSALASIKVVREKAQKFPLSAIAGVIASHTKGLPQSRLIDCFVLQRGYDLPKQDRREGEVPIVTSSGVTDSHSEWKVRGPGVVTGRSGTIGIVQYLEENFWPLNTTLYVKDFKGNVPRFVFYLLQTIQLKRFAGGSTVPSLDRNILSDIPIAMPDIEIQENIVSQIDRFVPSIARTLPILDLMEQRVATQRRSLLHAAFTGELTANWRDAHV